LRGVEEGFVVNRERTRREVRRGGKGEEVGEEKSL